MKRFKRRVTNLTFIEIGGEPSQAPGSVNRTLISMIFNIDLWRMFGNVFPFSALLKYFLQKAYRDTPFTLKKRFKNHYLRVSHYEYTIQWSLMDKTIKQFYSAQWVNQGGEPSGRSGLFVMLVRCKLITLFNPIDQITHKLK